MFPGADILGGAPRLPQHLLPRPHAQLQRLRAAPRACLGPPGAGGLWLWGPGGWSRQTWGRMGSPRLRLAASPGEPSSETGPRGIGKAWVLALATRLLQPSPGCGFVLDVAGGTCLVGVSPRRGRDWGPPRGPLADRARHARLRPRVFKTQACGSQHRPRAHCVLGAGSQADRVLVTGLGSGGPSAAPAGRVRVIHALGASRPLLESVLASTESARVPAQTGWSEGLCPSPEIQPQ